MSKLGKKERGWNFQCPFKSTKGKKISHKFSAAIRNYDFQK